MVVFGTFYYPVNLSRIFIAVNRLIFIRFFEPGVLKNHHMIITDENTKEAIACLEKELKKLEEIK